MTVLLRRIIQYGFNSPNPFVNKDEYESHLDVKSKFHKKK